MHARPGTAPRHRRPAHRPAHRRAPRLVAPVLAALLAAGTLVAAPTTASAAVPDFFVVEGSGFGHGVGMAQYGAYEMSRRGYSTTQILAHYYRGTAAQRATTRTLIDVQVYGPDPSGSSAYGDAGPTTITVRGGPWRLRAGDRTVASGRAGTMSVSTSKGSVLVRTPDGVLHRHRQLQLQWAGTPYHRPKAGPATVSVGGAHGSYRYGRLLLSASQGTPNVVNRLRLNTQYLYGLAEMPASWGADGGQEALRAQAVVARSYAVLRSESWNRTCRCHVVDDVRDQQFSGWKHASGPSSGYWRRAVDSTTTALTRGSVLTYGGRPVTAHYYSSSGGSSSAASFGWRTARSEDVWSSAVPYERSVRDRYSAVAPGNGHVRWRRNLSQVQAQRLFGLDDAGKEVASIRVAARWSSGQVKTLVAKASDGTTRTLTGKADQIRARVGGRTTAGSVPSAWLLRISAA